MIKKILSFVLAIFYFFPIKSFGQAGSLDPTFGSGGKTVTNMSTGFPFSSPVAAMSIQPDGKIVAAGRNAALVSVIYRFNPDGSLDNSFSDDGMAFIYNFEITSLAIQADGKIVIAGSTSISVTGAQRFFALARYNTDGSLDISFDGDGKLITAIGTKSDIIKSVSIQADGRIVVAGGSNIAIAGTKNVFALARYNSDGSLDNSFDGDGKLTTQINISGDFAQSVTIQPDGKIVAAGAAALARYNPDGSLDISFDGDGKIFTTFGSSVTIQADGKIVVAGTGMGSTGAKGFALARYNTDGSLDNSFDGDGKLITTFIGSTQDNANSVTIQTDNKIVVAGYCFNSIGSFFEIARYNADGSLDNSFDGDGVLTTGFGSNSNSANAIALQADGRVVAAGYSGYNILGGAALVRYNTDGSLDNSFDGDGKLTPTSYNSSDDYARGMVIQPDGKVVVAGQSSIGFNQSSPGNIFALARYNADGSLDNSFDGDGKLTTAIGSTADIANSVAIQSDGKIVAAGGSSIGNQSVFALARYNADGSLDNSFDGDGIVTTNIRSGASDETINSIAIQSDGKIVVAGESRFYPVYSIALARYNTDGSLDNSFDGDGKLITGILSSHAYSVAIQTDGKIVIAGTAESGFAPNITRSYFALARYNADGSLDNSFDGDGILTTAIGSSFDNAKSVAIQSDGRIIVAGSSKLGSAGSQTVFALARYNSDGSLDNSFDWDGKLTTVIGSSTDIANSVSLQADSKILLSGTVNIGSQNSIGLARYNSDGSLDNSFGNDGKVAINLLGTMETGIAAKIFVNRLYVAGYAGTENLSDFLVAAYLLSNVQLACPPNAIAATVAGQCSAAVNNIDPVLIPADAVASVIYTLSGATTGNGTGSVSGHLFNTGVTTVNYSLADDPSQTCSFTVTVNYPVAPAMSIGTSDVANNFCNGITLTANANVPVQSYSWSNGAVTQSIFLTTANNSDTYTINATPAAGCPAIPPASFNYNKQSVASSYTLLALNSLKLQSNNTVVNGSAGVVNTGGSANIKKNVSIAGTGAFLKAASIKIQTPVNIPNQVTAPAAVSLPAMQYNSSSVNGLPNANIANGVTTTITGNRKNVTIGNNCKVTLTGTIFGDITIGSGSLVLFTQLSVNVTGITMNGGTASANTRLKFSSDAIMRCAGNILVGKRSVINPDNYKLIIYSGKTGGSPVSFRVDEGGNQTVNAGIYIPSGKISVGGDPANMTYMNGKFIADNIETLDKNVVWNWYDCTPAPPAPLVASRPGSAINEQTVKPIKGFIINAWPNPSEHQFILNVESNSNETIELNVFDLCGRLVYSASGSANRQYKFGNNFSGGVYLAIVKQGRNQKMTKIVKQ